MKSPFIKVLIHFLSLQLKHEIYTVSNYMFNLHVHVYQPLQLACGSTIDQWPLKFDPSVLFHYAYFHQTWFLIADTSRKSFQISEAFAARLVFERPIIDCWCHLQNKSSDTFLYSALLVTATPNCCKWSKLYFCTPNSATVSAFLTGLLQG